MQFSQKNIYPNLLIFSLVKTVLKVKRLNALTKLIFRFLGVKNAPCFLFVSPLLCALNSHFIKICTFFFFKIIIYSFKVYPISYGIMWCDIVITIKKYKFHIEISIKSNFSTLIQVSKFLRYIQTPLESDLMKTLNKL